jgi:hypothetical protein
VIHASSVTKLRFSQHSARKPAAHASGSHTRMRAGAAAGRIATRSAAIEELTPRRLSAARGPRTPASST